MKDLIRTIICFVFLLTVIAFSANAGLIIGSGISSSSCDTLQQSDTTGASFYQVGNAAGTIYMASKIVWNGTNSTQVCLAKIFLKKTGSPTRNYTLYIYGDNSNEPDETNVLGTADVVASSSVAADPGALVDFNFSTPSSALSNGTTYWLVLYAGSADASHYLEWRYDGDCANGERIYDDEDQASWNLRSSSACLQNEMYTE